MKVTCGNNPIENGLQGLRALLGFLKNSKLAFQEIKFSLLLLKFAFESAALGVQLLDLLAEVEDHFDGWKWEIKIFMDSADYFQALNFFHRVTSVAAGIYAGSNQPLALTYQKKIQ